MEVKEFEELISTRGDYGLCPPPISDRETIEILIDHFLGKNWYVALSMSPEQVNTEAIYDIISQYRSKHRTLDKI
ncbi:MAG: hypothetical protein H8D45_20805 [Bacteroidetes bacterium]|nr:hypothetical protein [Bacteroidota bacterium]